MSKAKVTYGTGTQDDPWILKTPSLTSEYRAWRDESKDPPAVRNAVERISEAARKAKKPITVYVGNATEAAWLKSLGANVFVLSSDQGFLKQAATAGLREVRDKVGAEAG